MKVTKKYCHNFLLLLAFLSFSFFAHAKIISTYSVVPKFASEILEFVDASTWVFINIDDTIFTPKSKMFRYSLNPYRGFLDELYANAKKNPSLDKNIATLLSQRELVLVEQYWPDFITTMQRKGALVFCIILKTDPMKLIENFELTQYAILQKFNINCSKDLNKRQAFLFNETSINPSMFYQGIIFTKSSIGQTLLQLMKATNMVPKNIVLFDSRKHELENVEYDLRVIDVNYYGVNYLGIRDMKGLPDPGIVHFQQKQLQENNKWIEDDEAEKLIKRKADEEPN